jgi:hypothetical protein
MPSSARTTCVLIALAVLLGAAAAHAEPAAADKEVARNLVFEGRRLRKEGKTREAVEKFRAAHAIMHVPTTGIEVAQVLVDLGLLVEARDAMVEVSRMPPTAGEPLPYAQARDEARQGADELEARIPTATFVVTGAGGTPSVVVDGTRIDPSLLALPRKLDPGEHTVVVSAAGRADRRVSFRLAERDSKTVELALVPYTSPPATPQPEAKAEAEAEAERRAAAPRRTSHLVYAGFGTSIVGAAVGGVTGVMSLSKTSAVKGQCNAGQCPSQTHDDLVAARTTATISNVAFGVAAAGAIVGVVGIVIGGPRDAASSSPRVRVLVGPMSMGVAGTL